MLKTVNIFVETIHILGLKKQHLIETEIINVFAVTFDQINASLPN